MFVSRPNTDGSIEKVAKGPASQNSPGAAERIIFADGVDAEIGRGATDTDITYLALRNASGTKVYISPNAAGTGVDVSTTKP